jgi:hypothetical protein
MVWEAPISRSDAPSRFGQGGGVLAALPRFWLLLFVVLELRRRVNFKQLFDAFEINKLSVVGLVSFRVCCRKQPLSTAS